MLAGMYLILIEGQNGKQRLLCHDSGREVPKTFPSFIQAQCEAESLARICPGAKYYVLQALGFARIPGEPPPIWTKFE